LEELMGLLDDAIREHLELKRRRGADPDEVARQEDEALGDPRSGAFVQPDDEAPAAAPEPQSEPDLPEPVPEPEEPAPAAPEPVLRDEEGWLDDEPAEPQPTAEFTPPEVEREPEAVPPDEEPGADEDVLEETPEFLQETPEHDRLWFEQKPPRDFDFDN
jgi:hypothetical protein